MLDSTLKGENANSYVSVESAREYFSDRPYGFSFSEEEMFAACLVHATQIIDRYTTWYGKKTTVEQRLEWPRSGLNVDEDIIPFDIEMATYELALTIKDTNVLSGSSMSDFDSIKVSSIQLKLNNSAGSSMIPRHILPLLESYGHTSGINCDIVRI
jgi:hypothetical protein